MEENNTQQNKPSNAKGLIIIIIIIILAIAGYFIIRSFNKEGGGGNASSISEEDLLPLSALNLQGKWERQDGDLKYILNFKSGNELEFTQYDKDGNITAESDFGSYEVSDGVLYLTITSAGETFADSCNAAVSLKMLIIKTIEGSKLFEGTYVVEAETKAEIDRLKEMFSENDNTEQSNDTTAQAPDTSEQFTDSTTQSVPNETASEQTANQEAQSNVGLSADILGYMSLTRDAAWGGVYPEYDMSLRMYPYEIDVNGYTVMVLFGYEDDDVLGRVPSKNVYYIQCPVQIVFSTVYNGSTYYDLKMLLGDKLQYSVEDVMGNMQKKLSANIDGYDVTFLSVMNDDSFELTPDTVISECTINVKDKAQDMGYTEPVNNANTSSFEHSILINSVMNNKTFGIGATFPIGWTLYDNDVVAEMNGVTELSAENIQSLFETNGMVYDAVAANTDTGTNLNFLAEDLSRSDNETITEQEYVSLSLTSIQTQLENQGYNVSYVTADTVTFAGSVHSCINISATVNDAQVFQHQVVIKSGKYMGILTVTSFTSEEDAKKAAEMFYAI